jgi:glycosyltransferase involved in cell wall biosynthesis
MSIHSKHVWILNHYAQEPGGPGGTRHFALAKYLALYGWTASIIAASVELGSGKQRLNKSEVYRLKRYNGIRFLWLKVPNYRGNGAGRMVNMLTYTVQALGRRLSRFLPKPNIVIGSSVHPFAALAGAVLAKRHKVPFIFEVRDLWPQTLIDMGRLKSTSYGAQALSCLEKWLYKNSRQIITLLPGAHKYLIPMGIAPSKIHWIPNGVDLENYPHPKPAKCDLPFELMYFGAHGSANGLENILHALHILQRHNFQIAVKLRLIGSGPEKPKLINLSRSLKLNNVRFENPIPKEAIPKISSEANAFVFNLIDAPVFKYGISSNKLFDFMAAARPIIFCCNASNNPVKEAKAGLTVPPGDPAALAETIEQLTQMPSATLINMGMAARGYIEQNHSLERLSKRLSAILDRCISKTTHY